VVVFASARLVGLVGKHDGAARVRTVLLPDLEIDLGGVWV